MGNIERIYLTNEIAKLLDISIATVRNYAKSLERAGYKFNMKKQARLWTDKEVELIKEVQQFYANNDYSLEQCFEYIVTSHIEGEEKAKDILQSLRPQYIQNSPTPPQLEHLEGIREDTKTLISMFSELKENTPNKDMFLQLQTDTDNKEIAELKNEREELLKEIAQLRNELKEQQTERDTYKNELDHVKTLNMFSFNKWKRDNL